MTPGPIIGVSRSKTPPSAVPPTSIPKTHERPENDEFNTFTQLSSPPQTSPKMLPVSPAFEGLVRQDGHSGLSAAVEMLERTHGHKAHQHLRLPCHRPLSRSSGSSQEVVEQQLTQDDVGSQPLLPSEPQLEDELDTELRWPTDDESDVLASGCGSLNVSLDMNSYSASLLSSSEADGSHSQSQPFVLQTQAPYSSQATGWSETQ